MNLFNPENKIIKFIYKLTYSSWLNILWFICSLPIITIGASTTALYYVSLKMVRDKESNITREFFTAFRDNFKKSTIIWLILFVIGGVLSTDAYVLYHIHADHVFWTLCSALIIAAGIVYFMVLLHTFPLLSRFENTIKKTIFNAFMIAIRYLFCTIMLMVIHFLMLYIAINLFTPILLLGMGTCALLSSYLLIGIYEKLEGDTAE